MSLRCRPAVLAACLVAALAAVLLVPLAGPGSQALGAKKDAPKKQAVKKKHAAKKRAAKRASDLPNPAVLASPAPSNEMFPLTNLDVIGADPASARIAYSDDLGNQVIVLSGYREAGPTMPGPGGPQIYVFANDARHPGGAGGTWGTVDQFRHGGLVGTLGTYSGDIVFGLLPNGVDTVTVTSPSGDRTVRVEHNAIRFERGDGYAVTFSGPDGPIRYAIAPGVE